MGRCVPPQFGDSSGCEATLSGRDPWRRRLLLFQLEVGCRRRGALLRVATSVVSWATFSSNSLHPWSSRVGEWDSCRNNGRNLLRIFSAGDSAGVEVGAAAGAAAGAGAPRISAAGSAMACRLSSTTVSTLDSAGISATGAVVGSSVTASAPGEPAGGVCVTGEREREQMLSVGRPFAAPLWN